MALNVCILLFSCESVPILGEQDTHCCRLLNECDSVYRSAFKFLAFSVFEFECVCVRLA